VVTEPAMAWVSQIFSAASWAGRKRQPTNLLKRKTVATCVAAVFFLSVAASKKRGAPPLDLEQT
jgi:hypothetical protein